MVPPTVFVSGGIAVLQLCKEIYLKWKAVKRFRDDCKELALFVTRIEGFLLETEDDEDMTGPGWQAAFSALHEALLAVGDVFDDCAKYGIVRSLINADEMNLRLSSIAQRMTMALQLIPIQKAKVMDKRLMDLQSLQREICTATFAAARAAEQQSAQLKRLIDQSKVDSTKTHEMLEQVLLLMQQDVEERSARSAAAAAGPGPPGAPGCAPPAAAAAAAAAAVPNPAAIPSDKIAAELADLRAELDLAHKAKNMLEEQYIAQIIAAIEAATQTGPAAEAAAAAAAGGTAAAEDEQAADANEVPADLLCPITYQLLDDPVILVDSGQTYERAAIEEWLGRGNLKDPITGLQLDSNTLVPNVLVRKLAHEWLDQHPAYRAKAAAAAAAAAVHDASFASRRPRPPAAAAAAAGRTHLPASPQLAKCQLAAAAAAEEDRDDSDDDTEFALNPQAAAILAAAEAAAAARKGFAAVPAAPGSRSSSSVQQQSQQQVSAGIGDVSAEKFAAQQAYLAAVAAAAEQAGQATAVPLYAAMTAAPAHVAAAAAVAVPADATAASSHAAPISPADSAAAAAAAANGGGLLNTTDVDQVAMSLQQHMHLHSSSTHGSSSTTWQQPHAMKAGGAAAAAAVPRGGVTLSTFRDTFGAMAETRSQIYLKHGTKLEQQEALQQQQQQQLSSSSSRNMGMQQAYAGDEAPIPRALSDGAIIAAAAAGIHCGVGHPQNMRAKSVVVSSGGQPAAAGGAQAAAASLAYSTSSISSAGGSSAGCDKSGRRGFLSSFARRKKSVDCDAASSVLDDAASVSSGGSCSTNSSRRSKSVMNVLKSISYTMKYDDEKC